MPPEILSMEFGPAMVVSAVTYLSNSVEEREVKAPARDLRDFLQGGGVSSALSLASHAAAISSTVQALEVNLPLSSLDPSGGSLSAGLLGAAVGTVPLLVQYKIGKFHRLPDWMLCLFSVAHFLTVRNLLGLISVWPYAFLLFAASLSFFSLFPLWIYGAYFPSSFFLTGGLPLTDKEQTLRVLRAASISRLPPANQVLISTAASSFDAALRAVPSG